MFFAVLVIFFFLAGWTRMRKRTIVGRSSFDGAMTTARVIQQVVDSTSAYLGTITIVNLGMGTVVAGVLYLLGMPTPLMWGGIVALLNYIPLSRPDRFGDAARAWRADDLHRPLDSPCCRRVAFIAIHLVEANIVTPTVVGRRLTINPLMILLALSFWAWVWGTTGALLGGLPLLIILRTIFDAAGKPDIAGFLFEEGHVGPRSRMSPKPGRGAAEPVRLTGPRPLDYLARLPSTRV